MNTGQGAMEYLLLAGGGVLVAVVVLTLVLNIAGSGEGGILATTQSGSSLIEQARENVFNNSEEQKQAAAFSERDEDIGIFLASFSEDEIETLTTEESGGGGGSSIADVPETDTGWDFKNITFGLPPECTGKPPNTICMLRSPEFLGNIKALHYNKTTDTTYYINTNSDGETHLYAYAPGRQVRVDLTPYIGNAENKIILYPHYAPANFDLVLIKKQPTNTNWWETFFIEDQGSEFRIVKYPFVVNFGNLANVVQSTSSQKVFYFYKDGEIWISGKVMPETKIDEIPGASNLSGAVLVHTLFDSALQPDTTMVAWESNGTYWEKNSFLGNTWFNQTQPANFLISNGEFPFTPTLATEIQLNSEKQIFMTTGNQHQSRTLAYNINEINKEEIWEKVGSADFGKTMLTTRKFDGRSYSGPAQCSNTFGDVDNDGTVTQADIDEVINSKLELPSENPNFKCADIDQSQAVDVLDLQLVINELSLRSCGNGICEEGENITCPNDCLSCDGYAELAPYRSVPPITNEKTPLELTLELYALTITRSNLLEQKAIERKEVMLTLAEEDPAAFLEASIPKEDRETIFSSVKQYIEKSETLEGKLEVFEIPHLSEDGTNIPENPGFDYFLKVGTQRFEVKFAASGSNAISGTEVIAKGVTLNSYIIVSSGTSKNFEITREIGTSVNQGVQKIAIILTKPVGAPDPSIPFLEQHMIETNKYYQEISYGKASLEWDVYGWYETDEEFNRYLVADPYVDFSQYSRLISIDERNIFGGATLGISGFDTDDGLVNLSITHINLRVLQQDNYYSVIEHELGHNFGVYHANRLDCGSKTIDTRDNCISDEYGDYFDVMGRNIYNYQTGHMNSFHKEIIGWIGDNEIVEVNSGGTYILEAYEIFGDKIVLKIPRKKDEFGIPGSFYYLEYRTPIGFDSFITETQPNNGPQIRIFGSFPGGYSPSQLLDMTPGDYPFNEGISLGQTFTDPITDTTITVVSITESTATIQVDLTNQQCIRKEPTLTITPSSIEGHKDELFYYNFELKSNDESICSDREIYFSTDELFISATSIDNGGFYEFFPLFLEAGDTVKGIIELSSLSALPNGSNQKTIEVIDLERGLVTSANVTITLSNQNFEPINLSGKNLAKRFLYNTYNYGIYLIDDSGKIHRRGSTRFTADNIEDSSQLNANGVASLIYAPPWDDRSFEILDSFGNVYYAGGISNVKINMLDQVIPTFTCPIARDAVAHHLDTPKGLILLDAYGSVYYPMPYGMINPYGYTCQSWDGRTDYYRPGETHAVMLQPWNVSQSGFTSRTTTGYYILSKDGTTYACGDADVSYTQYNQSLPENFGLGDRYAVSFALDQENGIAMLDSQGNVYTSGTLTYQGEPAFGESIATDIQLLPESIYGLNAGYGVLATDGRLFECQFGTCDEWQNLHTG